MHELTGRPIAHRRSDGTEQLLEEHLLNVAEVTGILAAKIGMPMAGRLVGVLHDFGKYSSAFQTYIRSVTGFSEQDADYYTEASFLKGKIDHSTAGAQFIWHSHLKFSGPEYFCRQLLALVIASHHSGLIDCYAADGENIFKRRITKPPDKTHFAECERNISPEFRRRLEEFTRNEAFIEVLKQRKNLKRPDDSDKVSEYFHEGLTARFLLSCLVAADHADSAAFDANRSIDDFLNLEKPDWAYMIQRLEDHLAGFHPSAPIDELRRQISESCLKRACDSRGIFTLTVPTGGGKTLASLRFALNHAKAHDLEHVFYILPYTTIIEQNAQTVREILETDLSGASLVLEQHSNLDPEKEDKSNRFRSQSWDCPIIFTTMVQFLETIFSSGTSRAKRFHSLARSLVIFDEIQSLPINSVHMFCQAINFLVEQAGSSALLCTATQPLLGALENPKMGQLNIKTENEIIPNPARLFSDLRRTVFIDKTKTPMTLDEIASLAAGEAEQSGSCLVVVNTTKWAEDLYKTLRELGFQHLFHLSTHLCPAHRKRILREIVTSLKAGYPTLCVSTQLIECGVDISFGAAIRLTAGLDNLLQTAGRCNRHQQNRDPGRVYIVRAKPEDLPDALADIKIAREKMLRILDEFSTEGETPDFNQPQVIERYFQYYFYERRKEMSYPVRRPAHIRDDTLLSMLSCNALAVTLPRHTSLKQSFAAANKLYQVIPNFTRTIIVPYQDEGKKLISDLGSAWEPLRHKDLLRKAQQYSLNIFHHIWQKLAEAGALHNIQESGIYNLSESYYDDQHLGLLVDGGAKASTLLL